MRKGLRTRVLSFLLLVVLVFAACAPQPGSAPATDADTAPTTAAPTEAAAEDEAVEVEAVEGDGDAVTLRMTWYDDGNEGSILRELLDRFEAENPDIRVVMDTVPYASGILETLPLQLEAGEGPDMARVTQFGILARYMLDLRPYLADAAYWEENFGPFLAWMQTTPGGNASPGFRTPLPVTGP